MPDRERWRRDIQLAKAMGFNLMKFCLWVPPREFFDLCDEEGMLVWQEYPTWHPKLDQAHKADLLKEYEEFYAYDRNHPSVILRSLTCETGASAAPYGRSDPPRPSRPTPCRRCSETSATASALW